MGDGVNAALLGENEGSIDPMAHGNASLDWDTGGWPSAASLTVCIIGKVSRPLSIWGRRDMDTGSFACAYKKG